MLACFVLFVRKKMGEFHYHDEKNRLEHRYASLGLFLAMLPLLFAILGVPMVVDRPAVENSLVDLTEVIQPELLNSSSSNAAFVPASWLRNQRGKNNAKMCQDIQPRPDPSKPPIISMIRVLGERHSGVDSVANLLAKMFPNTAVGTGFTRGKYWFQSERLLNHRGVKIDLSRVLVVAVLRDPYSWIRHMQKNPWHAPSHSFRHDWRSFLTQPWTTVTSSVDKQISSVPGAKCQAQYLSGEVLPCRQSNFPILAGTSTLRARRQSKLMLPVYELNPINGAPLSSILELRKYKLLNYINMTTWVPNVSFLKVDKLAINEQIFKLQDVLRTHYNLESCATYHHEKEPLKLHEKEGLMSSFGKVNPISTQEVDFLKCNIDWEVERFFGYNREYMDPNWYQIGHTLKQYGEAAAKSAEAANSGNEGEKQAPWDSKEQRCSPDPFASLFAGNKFVKPDLLQIKKEHRKAARKRSEKEKEGKEVGAP